MSYGNNLITNPMAGTGDTSGWTVSNVTVEPGIGSTHYFLLGSTAYMYQIISSESIGRKPDIDFKATIDFELVTPQELYDSDVKGWMSVLISYNDETKGEFRVPCVLGIDIEGRELITGELRAEAKCKVVYASENVDIDSILVRIETSDMTDGLKVRQVKLQKNLETAIGELGEDNIVMSKDTTGSAKPPVFVFEIGGTLSIGDRSCSPLPIPYDCVAKSIYIYVDEAPEGEDIIVDLILADENGENGESIFNSPAYRSTIPDGEHNDEVLYSYFDYQWEKNKVLYPSVIQVGDTTKGADLVIEVRLW